MQNMLLASKTPSSHAKIEDNGNGGGGPVTFNGAGQVVSGGRKLMQGDKRSAVKAPTATTKFISGVTPTTPTAGGGPPGATTVQMESVASQGLARNSLIADMGNSQVGPASLCVSAM